MSSVREGARIHCGTFDAEQFWRDPHLAKLPGFADPENLRIVSAMDELLFTFCRPADALITRQAMDRSHKQYLSAVGFDFHSNRADLDASFEQRNKSMLQLIAEADPAELADCVFQGAELEPFAVIPYTREAAENLGLQARVPDLDIIRRVNTKVYSTKMKERLGLPNYGVIVNNSEALKETGYRLLQEGAFLVKDNYGVSGSGNLMIDSPGVLERIAAHMAGQEKKGKLLEFILEPYMDKDCDFSCQFVIEESGECRILSLQKLANTEFAYTESYTPEPEFKDYLERRHYFKLMHQIAGELHKDGYFGHVCIDSMTLKSGGLVPIVEINARKSMSLIKHRMDLFLSRYGVQGNLRYFALNGTNPVLEFEDVLSGLEKENLLFLPGKNTGILPLTANTLTVNRRRDQPYKGRIYVSLIGRDAGERQELAHRLQLLFMKLSLHGMKDGIQKVAGGA
ncbi:hypothetical protein LJK87_23200 [Paenibacillus sp. P25]|nr:hypothetical protein LJK87_23200 [Paenibacillus sp. P25]